MKLIFTPNLVETRHSHHQFNEGFIGEDGLCRRPHCVSYFYCVLPLPFFFVLLFWLPFIAVAATAVAIVGPGFHIGVLLLIHVFQNLHHPRIAVRWSFFHCLQMGPILTRVCGINGI